MKITDKNRKEALKKGIKPESVPGFRKNDNIIFFVCIIIAALFWGLIKLSGFYTETYAFKINYTHVPVDKQLTRMADSTLEVNIQARGFAILKLGIFKDENIVNIDLENIKVIKNEDDNYLVYTQELKPVLAKTIKIEENDITLSKTTLGFTLEDLYDKQISVIEDQELSFRQQFDIYEAISITPEKVKVFGPKEIVDTLTHVHTETLELNDIHTDKTVSIGLVNPFPNLLHFEPQIVTINIRVEKFTESSIETVIDFSAVNKEIKSFPATATVNFKIAQKDFNNIRAGQFHVVPELDGVDILTADKVHIKLVRKPEFTRNEWIVPANVEYLIIK
jgi:hypothetical protein